jgi:HTH-type transcriptional regulator/antitoxin HigA
MSIFPIRNDEDLARAYARIDELWAVEPGTAEADELEVIATLVEAYEDAHSTLLPGDPVAVLRYKLDELGISQRELGRRLGWSTGRVSEILSGRRELTLAQIRQLARELDLPAATLMGEPTATAGTEIATVGIPAGLALQVRTAAQEAGCSISTWVHEALTQALPFRKVVTIYAECGVSPTASYQSAFASYVFGEGNAGRTVAGQSGTRQAPAGDEGAETQLREAA